MNLTTGATVYCTRRGIGVVHLLDGNLFYLTFSGKIIPYSVKNLAEAGQTERSVFWHNPVVIEPPQDKAQWNALKGVITNVHALLDAK